MSDRKRLLDDIEKLDDFVRTMRQASTTSASSPSLSTRKRTTETGDTSPSPAKRLRTSTGQADTFEHKSETAPDASQSAPSRKRSKESDGASAAERVRVSFEPETVDGYQDAPPTAPSRRRQTGEDNTSPGKRLQGRSERLIHLARQKSRKGRYLRLLAYQDLSEACRAELSVANSESRIPLALAFIDLAENVRLEALRLLGAALRLELFNYISEIQISKDKFNPKSLFPCVATKDFIGTLPFSARNCSICEDEFQDGYDVIWNGCGKHTFHFACYQISIDQKQRPLCDCF